jgi:hypothetical protein
VYAHDIDVGGALAKVIANTAGTVQYERMVPMAVVPVGDTPVVFVDTLYTVNAEGGRALGELKLAAYSAEGVPVLCMHDEIGYRASFQRITLGLVGSLKPKAAATQKPRFVELHLAKLNQLPIGYNRRAVFHDGKTRMNRVSSVMILPRSPKDLQFQDSETMVELDAQNRLVKGVWAKGTAGELTHRIEVEREKNGDYKYEGSFEGKNVQGTIKPKDKKGLPSEIAIAAELRVLVKSGKKELKIEEYHPTIDPSKTVDVTYSKGAQPGQLNVTVADTTFVGQVDEHGFFQRLDISLGSASMISERVMSTGKP